jgi:hypothetical protein
MGKSTKGRPPPQPQGKSNAEVVAKVFEEAFSDPEWEEKEAAANAEREQRIRNALVAQGRLPPPARKG